VLEEHVNSIIALNNPDNGRPVFEVPAQAAAHTLFLHCLQWHTRLVLLLQFTTCTLRLTVEMQTN